MFTSVAVSVDALDIEEQQEKAEADKGGYCTTQQESITALTMDHLQEEIHAINTGEQYGYRTSLY